MACDTTSVGVAGRTLSTPEPLDVPLTFGPLVRGRHDPASRIVGDEWCHTLNSPAGPVTLRVPGRIGAPLSVRVCAWGPGRAWVIEHAPDIVGLRDDRREFLPTNALVAALHRRLRGLRMIRLGAVFDLAVATTIEQRVTTIEARRSWRTRSCGGTVEPAPVTTVSWFLRPTKLSPRFPDWEWRRMGVEGRRSETLRRLAQATPAARARGRRRRRDRRTSSAARPWCRTVDRRARDASRVRRRRRGSGRRLASTRTRRPRASRAKRARTTNACSNCWNRSGLIGAGSGGSSCAERDRRRASAPRARIHDLMRAEANRRPW